MTQYGANEFAVDFLKRNEIWDQLLHKPKHKKENGKDWRKIAGIAVLLELLHVGKLCKAEKVIKDSKLMCELGFTLEEVKDAKKYNKNLLHRDTIRNHFKAIPQEDSIENYYSYINFMREKRWIKGRTYVADGFNIPVHGESYEGVGKVWDPKKKKWEYGYKVVILMNVEEDRERLVGFALGPIQMDERKLLIKIFEDLEKHVDKIKNIMDVIVLDRGYWGYDFLQKTIVKKYKTNYVVIAKESFNFVKEDMRHLIDSNQLKFEDRQLFNRTKKELEPIKIASVSDVMHGYVNKAQPYQGFVNVVIVKKKKDKEPKNTKDNIKNKDKKNKKKRDEVFYVTNMDVKKKALRIPKLYGRRWTVENQGIRELSQKWLIRIPIGRTLNAITARICLVLKLYNAMKIMEMKEGREWQKNKEKIQEWGERSFIAGQGLIVYTENYFGTFSTEEFKILIEERSRRITKKEERGVFTREIEKIKKYLPKEEFKKLQQRLNC